MRRPDALQGSIDLLVLKILYRSPSTRGYSTMDAVRQASDVPLRIEEGSLYPALYRMEEARWNLAQWIKKDSSRDAHIYELTVAGKKQFSIDESRQQTATSSINQVSRTV